MAADYVYRNKHDTVRVRIMHREGQDYRGRYDGWTFDVFSRDEGYLYEWCSESGSSPFRFKRDAKDTAERLIGKLTSIGGVRYVDEGW